jgi:hypothetical protein
MRSSHKQDALELISIFVATFVFSFLINFLWEALHAVYLYQRHDFDASNYVPMLLYVSSVDSLIIMGLDIGVSISWMNFFWIKIFTKRQLFVFAGIGVLVAAIIEILSLFYFHRWAYKKLMPTVLVIGISPLIQLSITGLISVWLTRKVLYGNGLFRN